MEFRGVSFRYPGPVGSAPAPAGPWALRAVDLQVAAGEFVAVVGGNGSGKSTLARLLAGLALPDEGRVWVDGVDTAGGLPSQAGRLAVGLVLQNPDNQIVTSVVEADVAFGPENLGLPPPEIDRRVAEALRAVGMTPYARSSPHHLSGGQKQRVAIAGLLALDPKCLCCDEPTSMLDPVGRGEVMACLRRLHRKGRAIVLITHDMEEAAEAERVIVLDAGRIVADGEPAAVLGEVESLEARGLQPPAAVAVWTALRAGGAALPLGPAPLRLPELAARLAPLLASEVSPAVRAGAASAGGRMGTALPLPAGRGVELQGVSFSFPDGRGRPGPRVIDGIDLSLAGGECVCLLGATGSGKTTVAQQCCALVAPGRGTLVVDGLRPWAAVRRRRAALLRAVRRRVGLVFQRPEAQFFEERVLDEVAFGPRNFGLSPLAALEAARAALAAVGLPPQLAARSPFGLSGGQMRRVAIASVLAAGPRYLLLDEPTAGLDAPGRAVLLGLIRSMKTDGVGVLLVTHRMEEAAAVADRLLVLHRGRIVLDGPPRAVFGLGERLRDFQLEPPVASLLLDALAEAGAPLPGPVLSLTEAVGMLLPLLARGR